MGRVRQTELTVGLFLCVGFILLGYLLMRIIGFGVFEPGYIVRISYGFADGVERGAPVKVHGVRVGEVKTVRIVPGDGTTSPHAEVPIWVRKEVRIPADAEARINTLGLLGEKYIEITGGTATAPPLQDGDALSGMDPVPLESMARMGDQIVGQLKLTIESVNHIIGDPEMQQAVRNTLGNSQELTAHFEAAALSLRTILTRLEQGEGTLGLLLTDESLYRNVDALVLDVKKHPWKLLGGGRRSSEATEDTSGSSRGGLFRKR